LLGSQDGPDHRQRQPQGGGTGKITIAVNLACTLATRGLEVVLLDVDPQRSACEWARSGLLPIRVEAAPPINVTGGGRWLARAAELAIPVDALIMDLSPVIVPVIASAMMIADVIVVPVTPSRST
jgi:chromosome partitioning protein